jgi:hypothetical protein
LRPQRPSQAFFAKSGAMVPMRTSGVESYIFARPIRGLAACFDDADEVPAAPSYSVSAGGPVAF